MNKPTVFRIDPAATAVYAHLFGALSDPTRLTIVQHLTLGGHRVRDLVEHLGLAQSTISAHLAFLKDCGLVTSRPAGRATMYRLSNSEDLQALFGSAERILSPTGARLQLCSHLQSSDVAENRASGRHTASGRTASGHADQLDSDLLDAADLGTGERNPEGFGSSLENA
ncbi:ArsR/SmtB family transcription factor [Naumannella halotolerans]|uniref:DNA-binding transcriptional ArsR family regulator n=1 Tax=Naumannella halotolerans TaxID=993414 RepID=A0A4R7J5T4_9ACTN|nr:metalloregulator ArsR/SmtB family transcription factor [Naumannella halotolerans]TDT32722.1 DNA-binding transcriptional ArsR family regulator [Naumannella halotolerans]